MAKRLALEAGSCTQRRAEPAHGGENQRPGDRLPTSLTSGRGWRWAVKHVAGAAGRGAVRAERPAQRE